MHRRKIVRYPGAPAILMLALFFLAGCAGIPPQPLPDTARTYNPVGDYIITEGDLIDVKLYYSPDLNELIRVRPDGKISMQLIGEVTAAGLTPKELSETITKRYAEFQRMPAATVIVRDFSTMKIYVGGEVEAPGLITSTGGITALQAIVQAGGFKDTATLETVVILRNTGTAEPQFITVNLKEDLIAKSRHNDLVLKPYDIVFVPMTVIARLDQFVDQYIKKLIPITATIGLSYNLNPEVRIK